MNANVLSPVEISILKMSTCSSKLSLSESARIILCTLDLTEYPAEVIPSVTGMSDLELTCAVVDFVNKIVLEMQDVGNVQRLLDARDKSAEWLKEHFKEFPNDRKVFSDEIQSVTGRQFPWDVARPDPTGLALLYNFSPFQDTGATVASKRLREFSKTVDVIACSFLHKKKQDPTIDVIAEPYVASRHFIDLPPSWASWAPFKAFIIQSNKFADAKIEAGANYDFIYSRAMWAPSIFAGAYFVRRHPEIHWIAEFSDPLSLDVEGLPRGELIPRDEVSQPMIDALLMNYPDLDSEEFTVFSLAEHLAYAFADEIIFTNRNQFQTMLSHISSDALAERVRTVARVSNHPTLPRSYYLREPTDYVVENSVLNLGYFGEFYSSRSITEVTSAMRTLPDELAKRVHLHVFTNYIPPSDGNRRPRGFSKAQYDALVRRAYDGVGAHGIEDRVHFNASLPYLKFLSTTEKMDYLIVNDAHSGMHHDVNPYLPSKWSDYAGSAAKSWGFVEQGSILSEKPVNRKTSVGDALEARSVLWEMIEEKFPDLSLITKGDF